MKNTLAATALIAFSLAVGSSLAAQTRQRAQVTSGRTDLVSTLNDLDRVSQATLADVASMNVSKWKSGWKTGFTKDSTHTEQAQQAAGSLRRNLQNALPGLIRDVQVSHGGVSPTFKLYDDVSLLCEALDSLINASEAAGHKSDATPLVDDYSALTRIRRSLSAYIQQASANLDRSGRVPAVSFVPPPAIYPQASATQTNSSQVSTSYAASPSPQIVNDQGVKKIVVDDTVPERKPAAPAVTTEKKKPVTLTNLE